MRFSRVRSVAMIACCLAVPALYADHVEFIENFLTNPSTEDHWLIQGSGFWVPAPDVAPECETSTVDRDSSCTFYLGQDAEQFGGYVMVVPAEPNSSGNVFREEAGDWNNVEVTAVVEIRDGDVDDPGAGLSFVFINEPEEEHNEEAGGGADEGVEPPMVVGGVGAATGATGLGHVSTMVFQLSNQGVGFAWSHDGFEGDEVHLDVGPLAIDALVHNGQDHPASPNRWKVEIKINDCHVSMALENEDQGYPHTTVIDHTIEDADFVPIHGFAGVTASTGMTTQHHILHSMTSSEIPPNSELGCRQVGHTRFTADVEPSQVVPPNDGEIHSHATAALTLRETKEGHVLEYFLELEHLDLDGDQTPSTTDDDVTAIHIHRSDPGENGPHVLNVFGAPSQDDAQMEVDAEHHTVMGKWDDSDAKENPDNPDHGSSIALSEVLGDLNSGHLYFQIHTKRFPSGEVRGQILPVADEPVFFRGDTNDDGKSDISDAVNALRFMFAGEGAVECLDAADINNDGKLNVTDAVNLLEYLFRDGQEPPDPGPAGEGHTCDSDPEEPHDELDCHEYTNCPDDHAEDA